MSTNVRWNPILKTIKRRNLSKDIRRPMAKYYMDHDGTLPGRVLLEGEDIRFLEGLKFAGNEAVAKDAEKLIDAINRYESIEFIIEA